MSANYPPISDTRDYNDADNERGWLNVSAIIIFKAYKQHFRYF